MLARGLVNVYDNIDVPNTKHIHRQDVCPEAIPHCTTSTALLNSHISRPHCCIYQLIPHLARNQPKTTEKKTPINPFIDTDPQTTELPLRPRPTTPSPSSPNALIASLEKDLALSKQHNKRLETHIRILEKLLKEDNNPTLKPNPNPQPPAIKKLWAGAHAGVQLEAVAEKGSRFTAWAIEFRAAAEDEAKASEAVVAEMKAIARGESRLGRLWSLRRRLRCMAMKGRRLWRSRASRRRGG